MMVRLVRLDINFEKLELGLGSMFKSSGSLRLRKTRLVTALVQTRIWSEVGEKRKEIWKINPPS
jgi:hypothetical protein